MYPVFPVCTCFGFALILDIFLLPALSFLWRIEFLLRNFVRCLNGIFKLKRAHLMSYVYLAVTVLYVLLLFLFSSFALH